MEMGKVLLMNTEKLSECLTASHSVPKGSFRSYNDCATLIASSDCTVPYKLIDCVLLETR